mmetsp:Transcript_55753/g.125401  ORF Transcript_55753/g.125401 Transcript_55753/m.125401 type:complete len:1054 (-) Transcript_55753:53-3214(-)
MMDRFQLNRAHSKRGLPDVAASPEGIMPEKCAMRSENYQQDNQEGFAAAFAEASLSLQDGMRSVEERVGMMEERLSLQLIELHRLVVSAHPAQGGGQSAHMHRTYTSTAMNVAMSQRLGGFYSPAVSSAASSFKAATPLANQDALDKFNLGRSASTGQFTSQTEDIDKPLEIDMVAASSSAKRAETELVEASSSGSEAGRRAVERTGSMQSKASRWHGWPKSIMLRDELALACHEAHLDNLKGQADALSKRVISTATRYIDIKGRTSVIARASVIHPHARFLVAFDIITLFVVLGQLLYLPYALVWEDVVKGFDDYVITTTACFWLVDIMLRFFSGYHTADGEVELKRQKVISHYLKTWFALDLLCVSVDVLNLATRLLDQGAEQDTGLARVFQLVKMQRLLRALVVVRMLRVVTVMHDFMDTQVSMAWGLLTRALQSMCLLTWLTHCVACAWYATGTSAPTGASRKHWVSSYRTGADDELTIEEADHLYQYMASLHWSLAQITLGGLDINPTNSAERLMAICCNLFGLVFGGLLVSLLSTAMNEVRERNREHSVRVQTLREYLLQNDASLGMRLRVLRQVRDRVQQRASVLVEKDVVLLSALSRPLCKELRFHLFGSHIGSHPLMQVWTMVDVEAVKMLCSGAGLTTVMLLPDDELFSTGFAAEAAYLAVKGHISYSQSQAEGIVEEDQLEDLSEGTWASEATWWCHWFHVGTATAHAQSEVIALTPETVLLAMEHDTSVHAITIAYGTQFYNYVIAPHGKPVSDASLDFVDFNGLIATMPEEVHIMLGMAALDNYVSNAWLTPFFSNIAVLEKEVREGRSLVMKDSDGTLKRRVAVTVLQLENEDEEALTQVAVLDTESLSWMPSLVLPGSKRRVGESQTACIDRILETRLVNVHLTGAQREWKSSTDVHDSRLGIGTLYIKTTCVVQLTHTIESELNKSEYDIKVKMEGIATPTASAPSPSHNFSSTRNSGKPSSKTAEDASDALVETLSRINKVYILNGSNHCALYTWLPEDVSTELTKHEGLLKVFVDAILADLAHLFNCRPDQVFVY